MGVCLYFGRACWRQQWEGQGFRGSAAAGGPRLGMYECVCSSLGECAACSRRPPRHRRPHPQPSSPSSTSARRSPPFPPGDSSPPAKKILQYIRSLHTRSDLLPTSMCESLQTSVHPARCPFAPDKIRSIKRPFCRRGLPVGNRFNSYRSSSAEKNCVVLSVELRS